MSYYINQSHSKYTQKTQKIYSYVYNIIHEILADEKLILIILPFIHSL